MHRRVVVDPAQGGILAAGILVLVRTVAMFELDLPENAHWRDELVSHVTKLLSDVG